MAGKSGLIPVKRLVTRNGKTFEQTVYIKPKHTNKVNHGKKIEIPNWNFKSVSDFEQELARINRITDRSERKILKEHLLDHIENDLKIKWDKVPPNENKAFARNCLRAFSALKRYLKNNPQQAQNQSTSNNTTSTSRGVVVKKPGDKFVMDRETSKKLAREMRDKYGWDKLIPMLKEAGITWEEHPETGPNRMRALRALAKFIRKGGEIKEGDKTLQANPNEKLVIQNPNKELKISKYEKDSIQYDFEKATPKQKLLALATGILPTDEKTTEYLEWLAKSGQIELNEDVKKDFGLPATLDDYLVEISGKFTKDTDFEFGKNALTISKYQVTNYFIAEAFKGTPYEKDYENFVKSVSEITEKWGDHILREGVTGTTKSISYLDFMSSLDENFLDAEGRDMVTKIIEKFTSVKTEKEASELFDKLELEKWIERPTSFNDITNPLPTVMELVLETCSGFSGSRLIAKDTCKRLVDAEDASKVKEALKNGAISKKDFVNALGRAIENYRAYINGTDRVRDYLFTWRINGLNGIKKEVRGKSSEKINVKELKRVLTEQLASFAPLTTPEAYHIKFNISLKSALAGFFSRNRNVKAIEFKPLTREEVFDKSVSAVDKIRYHVGKLRQKNDKELEKYKKKYEGKLREINYSEMLRNEVDPESLPYPSPDDIKDKVKASLSTVPEEEAKKVEAKIQATHDRENHKFKTKVNGVYRVKRIAVEEKFQEINSKIDNAGFYYHGTSYKSAQKICGLTGGFKVFTDSEHIKTGSMLGYGIYLASQSSKSIQYVGKAFRQGNRGVLFLCKASLGNVVKSTQRGFHYNQPLMEKDTTDTVFMDRPHVINPEWAVKRAEQVVPRLWIDVERVHE